MNGGSSIHLYYDKMYGAYVAYGFSAFIALYLCKLAEEPLKASYSLPFQMPVVSINRYQIGILREKGILLTSSPDKQYYHIQSSVEVDMQGYEEWANFLREFKG